MKRKWIRSTMAFFLLVASANAGRFNRVIVFGESTSDPGNEWADADEAFPPSPPYYKGRWSNGPIWIDLVSARLGLGYTEPSRRGGTNYAYGGAQSGSGEVIGNCSGLGLTMCVDGPRPGYGLQIDDFLSDDPTISADDLFVIWGGHNDMSNGVDPKTSILRHSTRPLSKSLTTPTHIFLGTERM